jgi:hypothetical protein
MFVDTQLSTRKSHVNSRSPALSPLVSINFPKFRVAKGNARPTRMFLVGTRSGCSSICLSPLSGSSNERSGNRWDDYQDGTPVGDGGYFYIPYAYVTDSNLAAVFLGHQRGKGLRAGLIHLIVEG